MGLYRSLFCEMSCERCAARYRAEVQFETGDDRQQEYQEGQTVPPGDGLAPGDGFEGVADLFCPDCDRLWHAAHQGAMIEALACYVADGRLAMNMGPGKPILSADELRALGKSTVEAILAAPLGRRVQGLSFGEIIWEGVAGDATNSDFTKVLHADVTAALVSAGWPLGRVSLRDLRVEIGPDMAISVRAAGVAPPPSA